jgi:hypothetical protein
MGNPTCLFNCPQIKQLKKKKIIVNPCACNNELRCCDCSRKGKCKWCVSYDTKLKATTGKCVPISEYNSTNCPKELQGYDRCSTLEYFMNSNKKICYLLFILIILIIYIVWCKYKSKK